MDEKPLYEKRRAIHPRSIKGRFRTLKNFILILAYTVFFALPWIPWARPSGSQQAVEFNLTDKVYYIFNLAINVQSLFLLAGVLIVFAWFMFFVTGVFGRVFCGYFCFQTLWTDAFMKIEALIQGPRNKRIKLREGPFRLEKGLKIGLTWLVWLMFAFWSGFTFTVYWGDSYALLKAFFTGNAPYPAYFCTFLLTATTFTMAGFAREQVCTYMCPYSRFQSAMFDKDTLIISYDKKRGEGQLGRAKPIKQLRLHEDRQKEGYGDCIDCNLCVQVCPTGIDIRDGLQYQCISCGLCVDACHQVMKKSNFPLGLIRYSSENELEGKKTRFIKPKSIGYFSAIMVVVAMLIYGLISTPMLTYSVSQVRQPLMVRLSDGRIQNTYEIKLNNLSLYPQKIYVELDGLPNAHLRMQFKELTLKPNSKLSVLAKVLQDADYVSDQKEQAFYFKITRETLRSDDNSDQTMKEPKEHSLLPASFYR